MNNVIHEIKGKSYTLQLSNIFGSEICIHESENTFIYILFIIFLQDFPGECYSRQVGKFLTLTGKLKE